jgi:hypothetical protein
MSRTLSQTRRRRVRERLLRALDDQEVIVDEVHHHWIVFTLPALEVAAAVALFWLALVSAPDSGWVPILLGAALATHAGWKALHEYMDVFVITDLRVFRVTGILSRKQGSTPLTRILDITVEQPFLGLLLHYGHFTFESAAQEQGLRDIRFVTNPLQRDQTIQGLQMSLLRRPRSDQRP